MHGSLSDYFQGEEDAGTSCQLSGCADKDLESSSIDDIDVLGLSEIDDYVSRYFQISFGIGQQNCDSVAAEVLQIGWSNG